MVTSDAAARSGGLRRRRPATLEEALKTPDIGQGPNVKPRLLVQDEIDDFEVLSIYLSHK